MARTASPLRYPGGKSCLLGLVSAILRDNRLERGHYAEPYAGGCGLALELLFGGYVSDIHINDLDVSIWSFWHCVLNRTDELIDLIQNTPVTVAEWHRQKEVYFSSDSDTLRLAFATFYLNRTNRSGIIKRSGIIGGLEQSGSYKIDCRFNRGELTRRIERVAKYGSRIHLTNLDAVSFMKRAKKNVPEGTFFCIDPPYFKKGSYLYANYYDYNGHAAVAASVLGLKYPWIVTYDCADEIRTLYSTRRQFVFDIKYSIQTKRVGSELLIASKGLRIPKEIRQRRASTLQCSVP